MINETIPEGHALLCLTEEEEQQFAELLETLGHLRYW